MSRLLLLARRDRSESSGPQEAFALPRQAALDLDVVQARHIGQLLLVKVRLCAQGTGDLARPQLFLGEGPGAVLLLEFTEVFGAAG
ncbi:hypothetical protein [Streptomyces decoyicus]|uniref:hypothetical protein n=1 Tax=Streptomyces decoyicus TaxID=249567 RepID=UPI0012377CA1|nr:hypothetical protein [Streptomyces decoyicus]QZY20152.1 hypothetical protein K7C20_37200 [Streptomyces decoyicus]